MRTTFQQPSTPQDTTGRSAFDLFQMKTYLAADNFELRGEIRTDRANQAVFTDDSNLSKTLTTFAVQALYKF